MKLLMIAALVVVYYLCVSFSSSTIERFGRSKAVHGYRVKYITKTVQLVLTVLLLILVFLVMGIEYSQVSLFLSSVFAVIGVALFAQWSILSNITASLIIFFAFPYRVGDRVKVVDKDDDISGVIEEISLFHVLIKKGDDLITYPNSMILQKAVIKISEKDEEAVEEGSEISGK